jgi:hypothetical protein
MISHKNNHFRNKKNVETFKQDKKKINNIIKAVNFNSIMT